jgi:hypothetical protein
MSQIYVKEVTNLSPHGVLWRGLSQGGDIREEFERLPVEIWPSRAVRAHGDRPKISDSSAMRTATP